MSGHSVACANCKTVLSPEALNTPDWQPCPSCQVLIQVNAFPALFKAPAAGLGGEILQVDGEAGCFYHPEKKAVIPCESCGRFLCALCDVEFNGKHLCPSCLESGEKKGKLKNLERSLLLYDDVALAVATLPLLFWPLTLFSAPTAIFMVIRYWKTPSSVLPRTRWRFILAFLLAGLQVAGWIAIFVMIFSKL